MKENLRNYSQKRWKILLAGMFFPLFFTVYFLLLCSTVVYYQDVVYMDAIYLAGYAVIVYRDFKAFKKVFGDKKRTEEALQAGKEEICALRDEIREQNDYVSKWIHEVKVPLSALELMNGRNPDAALQSGMRRETERIRGLLRTMLMYGKGQSYFLIRENFKIEMEVGDCAVYTDRRWLIYILDQITSNAVKYRRAPEEYGEDETPHILFEAQRLSADEVLMKVEDNGRGIAWEELPWLFDRGYTGGNMRNGDYQSTGMGLYFARKAAQRLEIGITADSEEGHWTRFTLRFQNNSALI